MGTLTDATWQLLAAALFTVFMLLIIFSFSNYINVALDAALVWLKEKIEGFNV